MDTEEERLLQKEKIRLLEYECKLLEHIAYYIAADSGELPRPHSDREITFSEYVDFLRGKKNYA